MNIFKKRLLEFTRTFPNSIFDIHKSLLTRLHLGISHINKHKFKHDFNDTIYPICICGSGNESINLFLPLLS